MKRVNKSKFMTEDINDFINETQYIPKNKKNLKQEKVDPGMSCKLEDEYQASAKKRKIDSRPVTEKTVREKVLTTVGLQIESRKQGSDHLLESLFEVINQLDSDYNVLKENQQKLEHLTGALLKCIQQATNAHEVKLKNLREIYSAYKKECEEINAEQRLQSKELADELEADIKSSQQNIISETKRSGWETLRKTIFNIMKNDE